MDNDANVNQGLGIVGGAFADADEVGYVVLFKYGDIGRQGLVGRTVKDEE